MKVSQNLNMQLTQKLSLSNEMLQSLEIIQLNVMDLKEKVDKELLENPALEMKEKKTSQEPKKQSESVEEVFDERDRFYSDSTLSRSSKTNYSDGDNDSNRAFLEGAISTKESLHDWLQWQLNLLDIDEKQKAIGITLITYIDTNGFFKENLDILFPDEKDKEIAEDVLETIQTFDPPGVATKDIRDALIYQIESLQEENINPNGYMIIKDYFDLMLERKDSLIAKNLKITIEEVKIALEFLSKFEPYPGRAFDNSSNDYIVPDAFVYRREGEVVVEINDEIIPTLTVSRYLEKIAAEAKEKKMIDKQIKYTTEKISDARKFINIIEHRNSSLKSLVMSITKYQLAFFNKGPKFLVPLTMKTIGEEIGLAESTISRLAASKYLQTEWGIHPIRYFFTNSINKEDEDSMSSESVREIIKEIIEASGEKKLSDQKIADALKNRGINLARRTVAKYRNILNILPSSKRNI